MQTDNNINFHSELNPKLWDGEKLKSEVSLTLMRIASEFVSFLKVEVPPTDIIIVGSCANYNYTEQSDIDLHVVVDFLKVQDNKEFVKEYFNSKKFIWNNEHDIHIFGHEVECYVQDVTEQLRSSAVYSLKKNNWIKKPSKTNPEVDIEAVKQKVRDFSERIEMSMGNKDSLSQLRDKLKSMRQSGLETGGEYSTENLAFKVLRNSGEIKKLVDYAKQAYDKELSLAEWSFLEQ